MIRLSMSTLVSWANIFKEPSTNSSEARASSWASRSGWRLISFLQSERDGLAGLAAALDEVVVDAGGAAVNDGFMESPQLALSHLLFANAHQQFGLERYRVFPIP